MDTLDRYLIREFLIYFLILLAGLTTIYMGIKFFEEFWRISLTGTRLFSYYLYQIPRAVDQFVPVAVLMTTLLVLTNLSRQNEILAVYSGGMGIIRISSTFIGVVAVISTISFLVFDSLVPLCEKRLYVLGSGLDPGAEDSLAFFPSRYWYRTEDKIYNIDSYQAASNRLEGITLYELDEEFRISQRITAKTATYRDKDWYLEDGFSVDYPETLGGNYPVATRFDILKGVIPQRPEHFTEFTDERKYLKLRELRLRIQRHRSYGLDTTGPAINYHERLALVFSPLIFTMLGIPLATKPLRRTGTARGVGQTFVIVLLYLLAFKICLSAGKAGILPPLVAGWLTNGVFLAYALVVIIKRR